MESYSRHTIHLECTTLRGAIYLGSSSSKNQHILVRHRKNPFQSISPVPQEMDKWMTDKEDLSEVGYFESPQTSNGHKFMSGHFLDRN